MVVCASYSGAPLEINSGNLIFNDKMVRAQYTGSWLFGLTEETRNKYYQ